MSDSLTQYIQSLPASVRVSVALETLADSSVRLYHRADERVPAASLIKVPIMVEAMVAEIEGRINLDEIHILLDSEKVGGSGVLKDYPNRSRISYRDLVRLMITSSDNTATNILIGDLSPEAINARMRALGLPQTGLNRVMMDTLAARQGRENVVTAREMNHLLIQIYRHRVATPALCEQMLDFLKANEDTLTIPSRLPRQPGGRPLVVAHKTGTLSYVRADMGIVYGPRPFVLSVLVEGADSEAAGEAIIAQIARLAYSTIHNN
ncbi:serine hydrolase [Rudanella paleaurantiibacter]|uniref:beta-lactamase n=1 Tax=Rudanella paleaurantiibacter TaxID=2614655 RepID=A0A7J5TVH8_9BACT|nr:serine hydrolase [Rudanella paleaurantiibacter]